MYARLLVTDFFNVAVYWFLSIVNSLIMVTEKDNYLSIIIF